MRAVARCGRTVSLLASCNTGGKRGSGSPNFAKRLANALGRVVWAPDAYVAYSRGTGKTTLTKDKACCIEPESDDGN